MVVKVLVQVHASVKAANAAFIIEYVHNAIVIERTRIREGCTLHVETPTENPVLRGGKKRNAFHQVRGLTHGAIETVAAEYVRRVHVIEEAAISRNQGCPVVLSATHDL